MLILAVADIDLRGGQELDLQRRLVNDRPILGRSLTDGFTFMEQLMRSGSAELRAERPSVLIHALLFLVALMASAGAVHAATNIRFVISPESTTSILTVPLELQAVAAADGGISPSATLRLTQAEIGSRWVELKGETEGAYRADFEVNAAFYDQTGALLRTAKENVSVKPPAPGEPSIQPVDLQLGFSYTEKSRPFGSVEIGIVECELPEWGIDEEREDRLMKLSSRVSRSAEGNLRILVNAPWHWTYTMEFRDDPSDMDSRIVFDYEDAWDNGRWELIKINVVPCGFWAVVDTKSGAIIESKYKPVRSPQGSRIAAVGEGLEVCIWKVEKERPVLEFKYSPEDESQEWPEEWQPHWMDEETLLLCGRETNCRDEAPCDGSDPVILTHEASGWTIVPNGK